MFQLTLVVKEIAVYNTFPVVCQYGIFDNYSNKPEITQWIQEMIQFYNALYFFFIFSFFSPLWGISLLMKL